jgi:phosphoribosylanthranilate isomerase
VSVQVKICGVTSVEDALAAADGGADMLGLNFYERSRRFVTPERAANIVEVLRQSGSAIRVVGVFVDAEVARMRRVADELQLDAVQLHGNETPDVCAELQPRRVVKALRVYTGFDPKVATHFDCDMVLLDSWHANEPGGTGATFDWGVAAATRRLVPRLILAGGLHAENVAAAIRQVQPDAVDVCSGVEDAPGRKSAAKIREFIDVVRSAAAVPV